MIDEPHRSVVQQLAAGIPDEVSWALTGSTAHALQGVPLDLNDVDVQTDESGAFAIESMFEEAVADPVSEWETESMRSYTGTLVLGGVEVEVIGAIQRRGLDGSWKSPVDVTEHREYVSMGGFDVPVLSLEYEVGAYREMGREDRASTLAEYAQE